MSLLPFESILEWDLGGKNEVVDDDLGSPTPKKANLLETASPTEWQVDSTRPFPPSEVEWVRLWMEGREASSPADGRRSEGTMEGVIGRTSWDLRPGIIFLTYCVWNPSMCSMSKKNPDVKSRIRCWHLVGKAGALSLFKSRSRRERTVASQRVTRAALRSGQPVKVD